MEIELRKAILEKLKFGAVTFAELSHIPGFDGSFVLSVRDNLVIWPHCSELAAKVMRDLQRENLIVMRQTQIFTYAVDGLIPQMPVAKSVRDYKSPRWLPVVFDLDKSCSKN